MQKPYVTPHGSRSGQGLFAGSSTFTEVSAHYSGLCLGRTSSRRNSAAAILLDGFGTVLLTDANGYWHNSLTAVGLW